MPKWWNTAPKWAKAVLGGASIVLVGIPARIFTKAIPSMIRWWKDRKISGLAWRLRVHAEAMRRENGRNEVYFSDYALGQALGGNASWLPEVIRFLQAHGSAHRTNIGWVIH
jgi:hypothetical protein